MNIIFVCTGNTCRSPMAEGYLKSLKIDGLNVSSAGIQALGENASENSIRAMSEIGIDISSHISKNLQIDSLKAAQRIYCMTAYHLELLKVLCQSLNIDSSKLMLLDEKDIIDPFGKDLNAYRKCLKQITKAIDHIFGIKKYEVKYLTENSAKDIASLEELCFSHPWSENSIKQSMLSGNIFLGVYENDTLCGYASVYILKGEAYINNIATLKEKRRKGIAKALLKELISISIESECEFISLEVRESNTSAICLYTSFGFKEEGKRKNYYDAPKEAALILTRRF